MPNILIQQNIPLAPFTTFHIGGPAKFFAEVSSEKNLSEALDFAREKNLKIFILSGGSNVLISDDGFDGLVIKINDAENRKQSGIKLSGENIECWSGESLASVVKFVAENSLAGLEWAAGIPGTIGGAVRGNAGAFGEEMANVVESVKVCEILKNSKVCGMDYKPVPANSLEICKILTKEACGFSYRNSIFKKNKNLIILSAKLRLEKGDQEKIKNKIKEFLEKRTKSQPKGFSAGSFFQNPVVKNQKLLEQFEKDTGSKAREGKIPAGWLIDESGFRGKKIGGVMISEKHSNFIVNTGNGTAQDVVMLASIIKQKLREEFNVQLKEEVQYVGF
ncbi:TPA: UDP-N-acetylenolpyruvoylglucosamine reductase [Candidatus Moranbacteria bacterium]|nr:UDP-N-acetylenolpyruvoylglucosamine reductase [Candidatus Moranbacteria bacterium]